MGDSGNAATAGAGGAGGRGCVGTLGSEAGRGEGVVLGGDGTLGSAAGTDIGSGSKPGGTVGVLATVVGVGILARLWSVIALKIVDSCCRATCWLSLMGESGEAGDGCKRALVSRAPLQWRHRWKKSLALKLLSETRQLCLRCVPRWF